MTVTVALNIERVCIRINPDAGKLTDNESPDYRADFGIVLCQRQIVSDLRRGISQPHRRDIARVKEG